MRALLDRLFAFAIFLWAAPGIGVSADAPKPIRNEDVVKMVQAGLPTDLIITVITHSPGDYRLSPEELAALKSAGVPDEVLRAMVNKAMQSESGLERKESPTLFKAVTEVDTARFPKARYITRIPGSRKLVETEGQLVLDRSRGLMSFQADDGSQMLEVPYTALSSLLYERAKGKHLLTLHYRDERGQGRFAIIRVHNDNYRECLATLQAHTQLKIERAFQR